MGGSCSNLDEHQTPYGSEDAQPLPCSISLETVSLTTQCACCIGVFQKQVPPSWRPDVSRCQSEQLVMEPIFKIPSKCCVCLVDRIREPPQHSRMNDTNRPRSLHEQ